MPPPCASIDSIYVNCLKYLIFISFTSEASDCLGKIIFVFGGEHIFAFTKCILHMLPANFMSDLPDLCLHIGGLIVCLSMCQQTLQLYFKRSVHV